MKEYIIIDKNHPKCGYIYKGKALDNPPTMTDLYINDYQCMTVFNSQVKVLD